MARTRRLFHACLALSLLGVLRSQETRARAIGQSTPTNVSHTAIASQACAAELGQCGGVGWRGTTCCLPGLECLPPLQNLTAVPPPARHCARANTSDHPPAATGRPLQPAANVTTPPAPVDPLPLPAAVDFPFAALPTPTANATALPSCVANWEVCRRWNWTEAAPCCQSNFTCAPVSKSYSQCRAATADVAASAVGLPGGAQLKRPASLTGHVDAAPVSACVARWGNCKGSEATGGSLRCCDEPAVRCEFVNAYYSQCR